MLLRRLRIKIFNIIFSALNDNVCIILSPLTCVATLYFYQSAFYFFLNSTYKRKLSGWLSDFLVLLGKFENLSGRNLSALKYSKKWNTMSLEGVSIIFSLFSILLSREIALNVNDCENDQLYNLVQSLIVIAVASLFDSNL